ncbi:MAG: DUF3098 domain-containing protein [Chlorobi bacterium]|nr:DUF3098 domain-containing protein [Chlorobiota bacterium]
MATKKPKSKGGNEGPQFVFSRQNYIMIIAGLLILALGFLLLIGGGSDNPNVFNYSLFNFQRLTLAPILILVGYVIEILAILKRPKVRS